MTQTILIKNATLINEGTRCESDLLIEGQRIAQIAPQIDRHADRVIDAAGLLLLPGMIDDQVHFREPGLIHKGCIESESRAAVMGGITTVMEMPNTSPPTTTLDALESKFQIAAEHCASNYSFYLGASNDNLDEIRKLGINQACGLKIFMGASTGNLLVDDPDILDGIFRDSPVLIATHCEDTPRIEANLQQAIDRYGADRIPPEAHIPIRDHQACLNSSALAISLARRHGTRLHVLHLTTAEELEQFTAGPVIDKQITVEACVHHLYFSEPDYQRKGNLIKCNPAIKHETDRQALLEAVRNDVIDVIATDHAPHLLSEKSEHYLQAAAGLPLVQDAVSVLLELVHRGDLSLEQMVRKTSHSVADRFRIVDRGYLREGYFADLILVDPQRLNRPEAGTVQSRCGWTPFEGDQLHGTVVTTIVSGHLAWHEASLDVSVTGERIAFDR